MSKYFVEWDRLSGRFNEEGFVIDLSKYFLNDIRLIREQKGSEVTDILEKYLRSKDFNHRVVAASLLFDEKNAALKFIPIERWQDRATFEKVKRTGCVIE